MARLGQHSHSSHSRWPNEVDPLKAVFPRPFCAVPSRETLALPEDDDQGLVGMRLRGSCSMLLVGQPASQQSSGKRRCRRGPSLQDHVDQRVRGSNEQSHKGRPMRVRDKR